MKKLLLLTICFLFVFVKIQAQKSACNKLGAWIWVIEYTTCKTHAELADSLKKLGIGRIYVKVIDGRAFTKWPELEDKDLVQTYKKKGIEVWAWSYNYPNNFIEQSEAIYKAAKTGYQGYVVDVEAEFDKDSFSLYKLFWAFDKRKKDAIDEKIIPADYELRVTTWGNPIQHYFNIKAMDPFVSAYMPQTYVEQWGASYVNAMEKWIDQGVTDYKKLGATKPIHHIVAHEKELGTTGALNATLLNRFITKAGAETSVWRVPGGDVKAKNWETWNKVNWRKDFCSDLEQVTQLEDVQTFPNPIDNILNVTMPNDDTAEITVFNANGQQLYESKFKNRLQLDTFDWQKGIYIVQLQQANKVKILKIVK